MTEEMVGKKPSFGVAVMVVLVAAVIIGYSVLKLEAEVHIPLVLCALSLRGRTVGPRHSLEDHRGKA